MHRQAAECYFVTGDHRSAYRHFSAGIDPYEDSAPELLAYYQYAMSAIAVGKPEQAVRLLSMISYIDPDHPLNAQADELLTALAAGADN